MRHGRPEAAFSPARPRSVIKKRLKYWKISNAQHCTVQHCTVICEESSVKHGGCILLFRDEKKSAALAIFTWQRISAKLDFRISSTWPGDAGKTIDTENTRSSSESRREKPLEIIFLRETRWSVARCCFLTQQGLTGLTFGEGRRNGQIVLIPKAVATTELEKLLADDTGKRRADHSARNVRLHGPTDK